MKTEGRIIDVSSDDVGSNAYEVIAPGATSIKVDAAGEFDEHGGTLIIGAEVIDYTSIDESEEDYDVINLASAVLVGCDEGDPVSLYPVVTLLAAKVQQGSDQEGIPDEDKDDDDPGEPMDVEFSHELQKSILEGGREDLVGEYAVLDDSSGEWLIVEIIGREAMTKAETLVGPVPSESLPDIPEDPSDGVPPALAPAVMTLGGQGLIFVKFTPLANSTPLTYEIYMSTNPSFTPDAGSLLMETNGSMVSVRHLPDSTPLAYGVDYYFRVIAVDDSGPGPASVAVSGQMDQTQAIDLAAASITAEKLESLLVLASKIATAAGGSRIELDVDGIRAYGPDGAVIFEIPTSADESGQIQATVNANIWAKTLNAEKVIFRGKENFIDRGSRITLLSSVQDPSSPPSAEAVWPTFPVGVGTLADKPVNFGALYQTFPGDPTLPARFIGLAKRYSGDSNREIIQFASTTVGVNVMPTGLNAGTTLIAPISGELMHDMAYVGGKIFVLTRTKLRRYSSAGALEATWTVSLYAGRIGLAVDHETSTLYLYDYDNTTANTGNTLRVRVASQTTGALSGTFTLAMNLGGGVTIGNPEAMYIGFGGLSTKRIWILGSSTAYAYGFSSKARDSGADFRLTNGTACICWVGSAYNSTTGNFIGASGDTGAFTSPFTVYGTGLIAWSPGEVLNYKSAYAWYDSVGTAHTTKISPKATISMYQRAQMKITIPNIPLPSDPPSADDVNTAEIYVGVGTMYYTKRMSPGQTVITLKDDDFRYSSGVVEPGANNFPADSNSELVSVGGGFVVRGDGTGSWPLMDQVKDSGWVPITTFSNSWANYASSSYNNVACRKIGNRVFLRGMADLGTANATIFTLPVGFRPATAVITSCVLELRPTGGASAGTAHTHNLGSIPGRLNIATSGAVATSVASTGWVSLEGVWFFID